MKISMLGKDTFRIDLATEELWILQGCIREALKLGEEFQMRVGATETEALTLSKLMLAALDKARGG
jgi:hypothetical protein